MKEFLKTISIIFIILIVSSLTILFFIPKVPLDKNVSYSKAIYDSKQHLLRLTLNNEDKYRIYTPLAKISPKLIEASILQEDQLYFWHFGVNPIALFKAVYNTYISKSRRFGASTISMQVARMQFKINSKTIGGKLSQIIHAIQLELHYSKQELLEAYLNMAPYGGNIEGVGAASLIYFSKDPKDLNLAEALTLAIIPQNPNSRTPKNKQQLKTIRSKLFARWLHVHPEDLKQKTFLDLPLEIHERKALPFEAPHFVNSLLKNPINSELRLVSTLDLNLQKTVESISRAYIQGKQKLGVYNAAVLLVDTRDMGIKASLGSISYFDKSISGQINGTTIYRSPGSTLKPFIYGLALDQGLIHPGTILKDVPLHFGSYTPDNFDYDFIGPVSAKEALVLSRNIPAIYLESELKSFNLYQLLEATGIQHLKSESYYGLALSLGGADLSLQELVSLYAMLENEGLWRPLRALETDTEIQGKRLISEEASFLVLDMLRSSTDPLKNSIAFKTGTSSGFRDAWTIGSFGHYVLGVWVGNFSSKPNPAFVGKNIALPLFFSLASAIKNESPKILKIHDPKSMNLVQIEVCKSSGMLPTRYCQDRVKTWFIPGVSPIYKDNIHREIAIDKKTGLRTCHFSKNSRFEIFEFWPSDLELLFKKAGIQRKTPPPFEPGCSLVSDKGLKPKISSPMTETSYILPTSSNKIKIPLTAIADGGVKTLHWFVNQSYLGSSSPHISFFWEVAKPGKYVVRVIDEHGLSDARDVVVKAVVVND